MKNLRSCFFTDSAGRGYLLRKSAERHAKLQLALARLVCISVSAWLMFWSQQRFINIFCSSGCIDNGRTGCTKRFLFLVAILFVRLCWANSEIDVCPYRCNPFYTAISRLRPQHVCQSRLSDGVLPRPLQDCHMWSVLIPPQAGLSKVNTDSVIEVATVPLQTQTHHQSHQTSHLPPPIMT